MPPFAVIFARMVLPIVLGGTIAIGVYGLGWFGDYSPFKRYMIVAGTLVLSYKGRTSGSRISSTSAATRSAAACPTRSTCW